MFLSAFISVGFTFLMQFIVLLVGFPALKCLLILRKTTAHDRGKKIKCSIDAAHLQSSWRDCGCFSVSRRCALYSCPPSQPRISLFHKVLPPLSLPLSHYQTASWAGRCFIGFWFFLRGRKTIMTVSARLKAFPVYPCI